MKFYLAEGYHGGTTAMGRWGAMAYSQAPMWEFDRAVPDWLREHIFRRLDTFPGYKVGLELEAITFEHWAKTNPRLIEEIVDRVKAGQIEILDGTYTQPYGHVLSHESMARQFLYGQEALQRVLGTRSLTHYKQEHMFVPNMPGLLLAAGIRHAVLRSHIHHMGCCSAIEEEFILWQGPDGESIPTVPNWYADQCPYCFKDDTLRQFEATARTRGVERMLLSYGWDVCHDEDYIAEYAKKWQEGLDPDSPLAHLRHEKFVVGDWPTWGISDHMLQDFLDRGYEPTSLAAFIDSYGTDGKARRFDADYFQYSFLWGTHGDEALAAIRSAEASLYTAEVAQSLGTRLGGQGYPGDGAVLEEAWKKVMEAECHDIHVAPGSFTWGSAGFPARMATQWCQDAKQEADHILQRGVGDLVRQVTQPSPQPHLVLFNPLSGRRNDPAEVTIELPKGFGRGFRLHCDGSEVAYDCLRLGRFADGSVATADVVLAGDVPGFGFQAIAVEPADDVCAPVAASGHEVATEAIEAVVTDNGTLSALRLAGEGDYVSTEHLQANELTADFGDGPVRSTDGDGRMTCLRGGYLTQFQAHTMLADKPVVKRLRFYGSGSRIDFETEIDFGLDSATERSGFAFDYDPFGAVRVHFDPAFAGEFFSDLPLSVEKSERKIAPGQSFGCVSDGRRGLTLINSGNMGYYRDPPDGSRLSLVLAAGVETFWWGPFFLSGKIVLRYALVPHRGGWIAARAPQRAAQFNTPIRATMLSGHLPDEASRSLLDVSDPAVLATAMVERTGRTFLRLWNSSPEQVPVTITCSFPLGGAAVTDLFGENREPLRVANGAMELVFPPFGMRTLVLDKAR